MNDNTNNAARSLVLALVFAAVGGADASHIDFQPIHDLPESVVEDVKKIRGSPLVPKYIPIYGYIYDVKTGRLVEVPEATEAGRPQA